MFMCVVNLKLVNKLDLTWKQSFLIQICTDFSLASVVAHLSEMLQFFTKLKLQNISRTNAATQRQKMAADLS